MSKTIKQIADEIGVSKTAVRKKITFEIANQFTETIGNTVYISKEGESLIKSAFGQNNINQVTDNQTQTVSFLVSILQKELEQKNKQLEQKDKQINELNERLAEAHQMADKAQQLHSADKVLQIESKSSFWNKFKKKYKPSK